ncbi:ankyrin repeat-containing domain protein [Mycena rebaudengoi]|nr:ankyrin repeat-containing domain protein [Mycena rebaudengoi]
MDPVTAVGLVASILQLVAAAKSVIDLGRDTRNATKDQQDLFLEVQNLAPLLEDLKHRAQQPNNQVVNGLQKLEKPLGQLKQTMEHITRKLGSANKVGSKALVWTFWSKKEVDEDLVKIERFKTVLNAWLILDNWDVGQQQEKNYNQIRQDQYQIRTELANISQNQREYHDETSKTLASSSNTQRQDNYRILTEVRNVAQDQHAFLHYGFWKTFGLETGYYPLEEVFGALGFPGWENRFSSNNVGVAAAYLNHKESEVQSPSNILAGLWWQLVAERLVSPLAQQLYQKHQNRRTRPSLEEVREIIRSTVAEYSKVFVVVDALDEYPEAHRDILLKALAAMGESVSLMLTSRPNISSTSFFPTTLLIVEVRAQEEDIRRYIGAQIQNSFRLSKHVKARPELRQEIETKIAKNTDGMFLIAKLHIDSLATKSTVKAVRDALQNLPEDLEHTYDEAMDRIEAQNKDDKEIARRTLIWVANAKRPLTVLELQEALAIEPDFKADVDGLLDIEIILSVCVGLIIVDSSQWYQFDPRYSIIRLVHLTIQDYLDRVQPIRFPEAQNEITRNCLIHISYSDVSDDGLWSFFRERGLLPYAVYYCLLHAAGEPELLLRDNIIQFLKDAHRWRRHHRYFMTVPLQWDQTGWPSVPSKLWVAALFGLQEIARHLLDSDESISDEEKEGALNVALEWNCLGVVRLLIKHGTNGNTQRPFIGNILQAESRVGDTKAVRILLENGADVNMQGGSHGSALQTALMNGRDDLVQVLLENGADMDLQGGEYGTALQAASWIGNMKLVQMLLEHCADVNLQGGKYGTALHAALWTGSLKIVQLLLENGADVNLQGGCYGTALQAASQWGGMEVVKLLLEHGADVNAQGGEYGTPLQAASAEGTSEVVQFLLKHGADVNVQGGEYGTALQAASWAGNMKVVEMLLEHCTNVNLQGGKYGTVLQAASTGREEGVLQLLLIHGADANLQGGQFGTALQAASWTGSPKVVQLLLQHGADVNAQGGEYGTALQAASWRGCMEVMQLLLEHGADVNLQGGEHGTALQAASALGEADVVQLLLVNGADVNLPGGPYGTALQAASVEGDLDVVRLLLENGADVNLQGGEYGTAYRAAKAWGYTEVAELLVTHGAGTILGLELDWDSDLDLLAWANICCVQDANSYDATHPRALRALTGMYTTPSMRQKQISASEMKEAGLRRNDSEGSQGANAGVQRLKATEGRDKTACVMLRLFLRSKHLGFRVEEFGPQSIEWNGAPRQNGPVKIHVLKVCSKAGIDSVAIHRAVASVSVSNNQEKENQNKSDARCQDSNAAVVKQEIAKEGRMLGPIAEHQTALSQTFNVQASSRFSILEFNNTHGNPPESLPNSPPSPEQYVLSSARTRPDEEEGTLGPVTTIVNPYSDVGGRPEQQLEPCVLAEWAPTPTPTLTSAPPRRAPAPSSPHAGPSAPWPAHRAQVVTPAHRYAGWVAAAVAPLEEFIDHPHDVYAGLRESGSVFAAELAPDAPVHLSPLVKSRDLAGVETGAPWLVAIKSVALIPDRDDNDEEGGVEQKLVDVRREVEVLRHLWCEHVLGMDAVSVEDALLIQMERSLASWWRRLEAARAEDYCAVCDMLQALVCSCRSTGTCARTTAC